MHFDQHKEVEKIKNQLTKDFGNVRDWFLGEKLRKHFGKEETKLILFSSKGKAKNVLQLNFTYKHINIKQYSYLGCVLDKKISGEAMTLKVLKKINRKFNFFIRNTHILQKSSTEGSAMLLFSHILIMPVQPGTLISMRKLKKKKKRQNKCIHFRLKLDKMHYISKKEFRLINWLPTCKRVNQRINTITYNFLNNICPYHLNLVFKFAEHCMADAGITLLNLKILFAKLKWHKNNFLYWFLYMEQLT